MRHARIFTALLLLGATAHSIHAQAAGAKAAPKPSAARIAPKLTDTSSAFLAAYQAAEENRYYATLMGLRKDLFARSSWAPLGEECNSGALRVFNRDTTPALQKKLQIMLDRMDEIVTLYGAGRSIDDKDTRTLVRLIGAWEAGISRPKWDSSDGVERPAFAAGMTGEFPDPKGKGCIQSSTSSDTLTFWIPAFNDVVIQSNATIKTKTYTGPAGLSHARDEFFHAYGADSTSVLEVVELAPVVRWRDWAVISVQRLRADRGIAVGQTGKGGASYLMRRVQNDWRLVAVSRTWGG